MLAPTAERPCFPLLSTLAAIVSGFQLSPGLIISTLDSIMLIRSLIHISSTCDAGFRITWPFSSTCSRRFCDCRPEVWPGSVDAAGKPISITSRIPKNINISFSRCVHNAFLNSITMAERRFECSRHLFPSGGIPAQGRYLYYYRLVSQLPNRPLAPRLKCRYPHRRFQLARRFAGQWCWTLYTWQPKCCRFVSITSTWPAAKTEVHDWQDGRAGCQVYQATGQRYGGGCSEPNFRIF